MTNNDMLKEVGSILSFDPTSATADANQKARVVRAINRAKDRVITQLKFVNIKASTFSTVASQFLYTPFDDLDQILSLRQTTSEETLKRFSAWDFYRKYPNPVATGNPCCYVDQLGPNASGIQQIGLYEIPNAIITMYAIYRGIVKNITGVVDYTTGSITTTNNSTVITGAGTTFTAAMIGRYLRVETAAGMIWYKIATYTSATVIGLATAYLGSTLGTQDFTISERFGLDAQDESMDDLICLKAQHIITQSDRQYVDLGLEISKDYKDAILAKRGAMLSRLDGLDMLAPDNSGRKFNMADLSSYDIFQ